MWRLLAAAAVVTAICAFGAFAQEKVAGRVIDLVLPTTNLVLSTASLVFKVEDLGGRVETLRVKETATETRIELPADILFDFDKADIRPLAAAALKQVADMVRQHAKGVVRIEGHTDSKGARAYNEKLSARRAQSVQRWLTEREGLGKVKFTTTGFAATRPAAPNTKPDGSDDPEGRQKNRRVEIVFGRR